MQKNIVILISGTGSNMQALVRSCETQQWAQRYQAKIAAVISNKADAAGLAFAAKAGIPTHVIDHKAYAAQADARQAFDAALAQTIDRYQPHLVVLAGFMRILTFEFVQRYAGKLLNIHPSLLPAFPGLNTHERAIAAGCQFAGATVHLVTAELDNGPIVEQAVVPILPGDTAEHLAQRVLSQEHLIYPRAVEKLLSAPHAP